MGDEHPVGQSGGNDEIVEAEIVQEEKRPLWISWQERPLGLREVLAVGLLVALVDLVVYRGHGFAGYALLFTCVPVIVLLGSIRPKLTFANGLFFTLLLLIAGRLLWQGDWTVVTAGFLLVPALSMTFSGRQPYVPEVVVFATQLLGVGYRRIACYFDSLRHVGPIKHEKPSLDIMLPLAALVTFSGIFVMANPALVNYVSDAFVSLGELIQRWTSKLSFAEFLIWFVTAWIGFGLMRPKIEAWLPKWEQSPGALPEAPSPLYKPLRNTLLTVVVLFAVYLVFEFQTLWFREFPEGFYYAGYAHQGAAWLTIALALATLLLSLTFRTHLLADPRCNKLKKIAWLWSAQNFILAVAVYNRMLIYIDFNGMTRMRTIGLIGITTVVVGFVLVLVKIARERGFLWLIRHQLWALAAATLIYVLLPVDWIVHRYNTNQVLQGNLAPSVQVAVHPITDEGYLSLTPMLQSDDSIIQEGVAAKLALRWIAINEELELADRFGWSRYQMGNRRVSAELAKYKAQFQQYLTNSKARADAIRAFEDYTYRWY